MAQVNGLFDESKKRSLAIISFVFRFGCSQFLSFLCLAYRAMSFRGGLPGAHSCEGAFARHAAPSAGWVGWSEKQCVLPSSALFPSSTAVELYVMKSAGPKVSTALGSFLHAAFHEPPSAPSRILPPLEFFSRAENLPSHCCLYRRLYPGPDKRTFGHSGALR